MVDCDYCIAFQTRDWDTVKDIQDRGEDCMCGRGDNGEFVEVNVKVPVHWLNQPVDNSYPKPDQVRLWLGEGVYRAALQKLGANE